MKKFNFALAIAAALAVPTTANAGVSTTIPGMSCPAVFGRANPEICACRYVTVGGRQTTRCVVR